MNLSIITYPNPILKKVSKDVKFFDKSLHNLLNNMYEIMAKNNGIGLAAIQVGIDLNILLVNLPNEEEEEQTKDNLLEIINPVISESSGSVVYQEGCLSIPAFYEDIERFEKIKLDFFNRNGEKQSIEADGLLSIAIQHEIDHLKGKLFIDTFSFIQRKKFDKEWKKNLKAKKKKIA
jgi:peptide deformylase